MKTLKLLLLVTFSVTALCAYAQDKTMNIYKSDRSIKSFDFSQVDSLKFVLYGPGSSEADVDVFYLDFWEETQGAPGTDEGHNGDLRIIAKIDKNTGTITYELPLLPGWFTPEKMTVFPAVIQISDKASISPNWDVPQDFTKDVVYTITAENGKQKVWTVIAPKHYMKEKWFVDYTEYESGGSQNPNSIGILGDHLVVSRAPFLISKSDGSMPGGGLNTTGLLAADGGKFGTQGVPFFVTNDDAGNLIGTSLYNSTWNQSSFAIYKWTSPTAAPVLFMDYPLSGNAFGRKVQAIGDMNGKGLIIASNMVDGDGENEAAKNTGEHYIWKIEGGVVDTNNPLKVQTNIRWDNNNYGYQLLSPLGLDPEGPWYVGTHRTQIGKSPDPIEYFYPTLHFGNIGSVTAITGPFDFGDATRHGWGNSMWAYQKVFTFDGLNMIATMSAADDEYAFAVMERKADNTHVKFMTATIDRSDTTPNGNGTGSFATEKVGDDVFFYVFPTNRAIVCYQLGKF